MNEDDVLDESVLPEDDLLRAYVLMRTMHDKYESDMDSRDPWVFE